MRLVHVARVFVVVAVLSLMVGSRREEEDEEEGVAGPEQRQDPHTKARYRIRDITNIITTRLRGFMARPPKDSAQSSDIDKGASDTTGRLEDDVRVFPATPAEDDAAVRDTPAHGATAKDSTADCHSKDEFCDAQESSTSDDSDAPGAVMPEGEESSSTSDGDADHPGAAAATAGVEADESSSSSSDDDKPGVEVSNTSFKAVSRDDGDSFPGDDDDDDVSPTNTLLYDAESTTTSDDYADTTTSSEEDYEPSLSPEHLMLDDHVPATGLPSMSVPIEDVEGNVAAEMEDNGVCSSLEGNAPDDDMGDCSADVDDDSDDNYDFDMEDDSDYDDVDVGDYDDTESDSEEDTDDEEEEDSDDDIEDIPVEGGDDAAARNTASGADDANDHD